MCGIKKVIYLTVFLVAAGIIFYSRTPVVHALKIDTHPWGTKYSNAVYYFGQKTKNSKNYIVVSKMLSASVKEDLWLCENAIIAGGGGATFSLNDLDTAAKPAAKVNLVYDDTTQPVCVTLIDIDEDWNVSDERAVIEVDVKPATIWVWDRHPDLKITGTIIKGSNADANFDYSVIANQSFSDSLAIEFENSNKVKVLAKGTLHIPEGKTVTEIISLNGPVDRMSFSFHDRFNFSPGGQSVEYRNFGLFRTSIYDSMIKVLYGAVIILLAFLLYRYPVKSKSRQKTNKRKKNRQKRRV